MTNYKLENGEEEASLDLVLWIYLGQIKPILITRLLEIHKIKKKPEKT